MSVTGQIIEWVVNVVGIQGISVTVVVVLLAVASIASKIGSLFAPASKAVNAGTSVSRTLAYIKVISITLLALSLLGIASIDTTALREYHSIVQSVDWSWLGQLDNLLPEVL